MSRRLSEGARRVVRWSREIQESVESKLDHPRAVLLGHRDHPCTFLEQHTPPASLSLGQPHSPPLSNTPFSFPRWTMGRVLETSPCTSTPFLPKLCFSKPVAAATEAEPGSFHDASAAQRISGASLFQGCLHTSASTWQDPIRPSEYLVQGGPSTMRAAVMREVKGEMSVETLRIPVPKAEEVLVKTRACGVCHTDLHVMRGDVPFPFPCVLGHEVSGEVVHHGPNTSEATLHRLPAGTRVVGAFIMPCGGCFFCSKGKEDLCETFFHFNRGKGALYDGHTRLFRASDGAPIHMYSMGGLAEYCVVPATALAPLPPPLPLAESAVIGCALFTAYGAVRNAADVRAGESVVVVGAGGVGSSCVQVARSFGASTIVAVDLAAEKLESCKALGATHTINACGMSKADVAALVRDITGGRGADVAIEALGIPQTFETAVECVRDGGRAVMVGIAPVGVQATVEITRIVRRNISIIGSYGAKARVDLPTIVQLASTGQLSVSGAVKSRHRLEDAGKVYKRLHEGGVLGRAVIDMELS